jgi:hypothetical protein
VGFCHATIEVIRATSLEGIVYMGFCETPFGKVAREGNCRRSTLTRSTLESIRFVTGARIEAEQQNGQGAND